MFKGKRTGEEVQNCGGKGAVLVWGGFQGDKEAFEGISVCGE